MAVKRFDGTQWVNYAGNGVQGIQGTQGLSGTAGAQGTNGATGAQGTAGTAGSAGASGIFTPNVISTNTNLASQNSYFVTTSGGALTLTLPSSPSVGAEIHVFDATGNAASNNITVANNGSNVNGASQNLTIDKAYAAVNLVYVGSSYGWRVS